MIGYICTSFGLPQVVCSFELYLTYNVSLTSSADESFAEIVQAKYTNYATDDADYPDTSNIMKLSSFPKPIPTKSSLVLESSKALKKEQEGVS